MMDCTQFADVSKMVDQEVPRMMDRTQFHRQLQHLTPAEIAPLDAMAGPGFPAMWYDMASSMYAWLVDAPVAGLSNPDKAALSILLTMQIADAMGGEMHYLPKGRSWRGQALAEYVVAAFSGRNHCELAAETGVSESRIRQILDAERVRRMAQTHGKLPRHRQPKQRQKRKGKRTLRMSRAAGQTASAGLKSVETDPRQHVLQF